MNAPVTQQDIMAQSRREPASQATRVEQSRAVAEVQAAFTVAQGRPRDPQAALKEILDACKMKSVAESAFFKFPRGGGSVTGETIHLAVELARSWGNISYSIAELERDDGRGISEMLATATDLQTNTSSRTSFIVPHKRDKEGNRPASPLTSMRDIYENNANMGARRLRECIFRVLPTWLVDAARDECYKTLASGSDERPIAVRVTAMIEGFGKLGISKERIEAKVGPTANLTEVDLAALGISYKSIQRREISADEEFPRVGAEEATDAARRLADQSKPKDPEPEQERQAETKAEERVETVSEEAPAAEEGRADEQMGDQHDDTDGGTLPEWTDKVNLWVEELNGAGNLGDVKSIEKEFLRDRATLPDEPINRVESAINAARSRLNQGNN